MINHMCLILIFVLLFNSYASASSRISSWVRALASLPSLVRGFLESILHITWGRIGRKVGIYFMTFEIVCRGGGTSLQLEGDNNYQG